MQAANGQPNSRVTYHRDFPPGCGLLNSSYGGFSDTNPFHRCIRDFPPGCGLNSSKTTTNFAQNLPASEIRSDSTTWRRNVTAVKSQSLMSDESVKRNPQIVKEKHDAYKVNERKSVKREKVVEMIEVQKVKGKEPVSNCSGKRGSGEREKVLEMVSVFRKRCTEISLSWKGVRRVDTTAYNELKVEGKLVNRSAMMIGDVPGIEIGDKFHYRIELVFVGLHKQTQDGIDSMEWCGGRIATSIVANERHSDKLNDPNALIYVGEGGVLKRHEVGIPPDPELKSSNRALWTSMKEKRPIRVIRGLTSERFGQKILYVYDGLYEICECEKKKGLMGNMIFEFRMSRCSGQPAVPWRECRQYRFYSSNFKRALVIFCHSTVL